MHLWYKVRFVTGKRKEGFTVEINKAPKTERKWTKKKKKKHPVVHKMVGGAWTEYRPSTVLGTAASQTLCVFTQRSQVHNGFLHAFLAAAVGLQGDQRVQVERRVAGMRLSPARHLRPGLPVEAAADAI